MILTIMIYLELAGTFHLILNTNYLMVREFYLCISEAVFSEHNEIVLPVQQEGSKRLTKKFKIPEHIIYMKVLICH